MNGSHPRRAGFLFTAILVAVLGHAASPDPSPGVDNRVVVLTSPAMRQNATFRQEPEFPAAARQFRLSGEVVVELVVGVDGKVETVSVTKGYPILNEAVLRAVKRWAFAPYMVDGHARKVKSTLSFNFQL